MNLTFSAIERDDWMMRFLGGDSAIQASLMAPAAPSSDSDPDGLTPALCLDDCLFQPMNPEATVEHFAHFAAKIRKKSENNIKSGMGLFKQFSIR